MKRIVAIASLFAFAVAFVLGTAATQAQYPPPSGSITVTGSSTTSQAGGDVTLTCTLRAADGSPIVGTPCTLTIVSEPGTDAGLDSKTVTKITDANGQITDTLHVGSTPGLIIIAAQSGGLQSTLVVQVMGSAAPPAAPVEGNVILPPSTGSGGLLP
jgi:hypothetical protein